MPKLLQDLLSSHTAARPDGVAVCWKDEMIPYGELDRVANQLAHTLRGHGCQFGDRVAVLIPNSANALLAILGILKAGCVAEVRTAAQALAKDISESAPLAVMETRATVRAGLADRVKAATDHELKVQSALRQTEDFKEGVRAVNERRVANFQGR